MYRAWYSGSPHALYIGMTTLFLKMTLCSFFSLLSEENMLACNLETLFSTYHRYFSRQDSFRVGSAIVLLLRMRDLLPGAAQRLAALALLHELYRSDSTSSNPFALFFVELLQPSLEGHNHGASLTERWFLAQIMAPTLPREVNIIASSQQLLMHVVTMCSISYLMLP